MICILESIKIVPRTNCHRRKHACAFELSIMVRQVYTLYTNYRHVIKIIPENVMRVLIDLWMKIYDLCMERSVKARACVRKLLKYNYKQPQRNIWWKLFHSVDFQLSISLEWKQWIYANLLFKNVEKRAHTQTHMVLSRYPTSYIQCTYNAIHKHLDIYRAFR